MYAKIFALGKCGMFMTQRNRSGATKWLTKKSYFGLLAIVVVFCFAMREVHHIQDIMKRVHHKHHEERKNKMHEGEAFSVEFGRNLLSSSDSEKLRQYYGGQSMVLGGEDEQTTDDCGYSTQDLCQQDPKCSWCKSAAVPSSCKPLEQ